MSTTFRSEGWSVRPSFVPHGATSPVTLLGDEHGLTQLSGDPEVAWQTPWTEMSSIQLLRFSRGLALFATIDGVRYCWRANSAADFDDVSDVVLEHGGQLIRRKRRAGVYAVAAVVLLASLAGGIAALFTRTSPGVQELADARAVNLSLKDLPSDWYLASGSALQYLIPPVKDVIVPTPTTTAPKANSAWAQISAQFQRCLGVSAHNDRVYGAAGQQPDYQVSSPIFGAATDNGIEVGTISQYYATTTMVRRDTAEMSRTNFGGCIVASSAALIQSGYTSNVPTVPAGENWQPVTYAKGWIRGGVATVTEPGLTKPLHLVMVVATSGHYEVTLAAIVAEWPQTRLLLANLANTLMSRITSTTANAV